MVNVLLNGLYFLFLCTRPGLVCRVLAKSYHNIFEQMQDLSTAINLKNLAKFYLARDLFAPFLFWFAHKDYAKVCANLSRFRWCNVQLVGDFQLTLRQKTKSLVLSFIYA